MKNLTLRRNDVVFREGDIQHTMYQVRSGVIGIYANYETEYNTLLTELNEGAFFGEMALLEDYPRSAAAVVLSDRAVLFEISSQELSQFFTEDTQRILSMMRHLSGRVRSLTKDYQEACGTVAQMNRKGERPEGLAAKIRRFAKEYFSSLTEDKAPEPSKNEEVASAQDAGTPLHSVLCSSGDILFREGEESRCMYDLVSGRIGIYKDYGTQKEALLEEVEPGSYLGEMGLIDRAPRSATAVALTDNTRLYVIYETDLAPLMTENPGKTLHIFQKLSARLRRLTRDYLEMCRLIAELDEAEKSRRPVSQKDRELARKAEEIWRLSLIENSANYTLLGMGV